MLEDWIRHGFSREHKDPQAHILRTGQIRRFKTMITQEGVERTSYEEIRRRTC